MAQTRVYNFCFLKKIVGLGWAGLGLVLGGLELGLGTGYAWAGPGLGSGWDKSRLWLGWALAGFGLGSGWAWAVLLGVWQCGFNKDDIK